MKEWKMHRSQTHLVFFFFFFFVLLLFGVVSSCHTWHVQCGIRCAVRMSGWVILRYFIINRKHSLLFVGLSVVSFNLNFIETNDNVRNVQKNCFIFVGHSLASLNCQFRLRFRWLDTFRSCRDFGWECPRISADNKITRKRIIFVFVVFVARERDSVQINQRNSVVCVLSLLLEFNYCVAYKLFVVSMRHTSW